MYLVYVYDNKKNLVSKFTEEDYTTAIHQVVSMVNVEGKSYEILKVS